MIKYIIERSANHCHLTETDALYLFGDDALPENLVLKPLAIVGEYATNLKVKDINGNSYTVVYPWRFFSQIEVAQSDYYKMFKVYAKRVDSGGITNSKSIEICGGIKISVLVVRAHIHIPPSLNVKREDKLDFIFPLEIKYHDTIDGIPRIHLDIDQYTAIQGVV